MFIAPEPEYVGLRTHSWVFDIWVIALLRKGFNITTVMRRYHAFHVKFLCNVQLPLLYI